jgi:hypothetical protein
LIRCQGVSITQWDILELFWGLLTLNSYYLVRNQVHPAKPVIGPFARVFWNFNPSIEQKSKIYNGKREDIYQA